MAGQSDNSDNRGDPRRARTVRARTEGEGDFYQRWRVRVREWAEGKPLVRQLADAGFAGPDLSHLLVRLMADGRVALFHKAKLAIALAYVASPIDLMPEALVGPIGILDDIAVVAWALQGLLREENWHVVSDHWAGDERVLLLLQRAIDFLARSTPSKPMRRVQGFVGRAEDALSGRESGPVNPKKTITVLPGGRRSDREGRDDGEGEAG